MYIFGYGSLMAKEEIERTLGRIVSAESVIPASLAGYRRDWSAVRSNTELTGKWLVERSSGFLPQHVAYLNIVPDKDSVVDGVVFPVTEEDIQKMDRREVGYERIKVSVSGVDGRKIDGTVFTYIDKVNDPYVDNVYISYHYLNFVRFICQNLGRIRKMYFDHTPLPDAWLADLDVIYFDQGFSELYKLELFPSPNAKKIASRQRPGHWICHIPETKHFHSSALDAWEQRVCLACGTTNPDLLSRLERDICFIVRAIVDDRKKDECDIKGILSYHLAHELKCKHSLDVNRIENVEKRIL
ncbi:MAG: gamma-glutamylcyclotransferase [Methanobacteriota archaeon]|nr:MAG: gamma-glutamylcyclotransferase [Euryarchaeota archaeon]